MFKSVFLDFSQTFHSSLQSKKKQILVNEKSDKDGIQSMESHLTCHWLFFLTFFLDFAWLFSQDCSQKKWISVNEKSTKSLMSFSWLFTTLDLLHDFCSQNKQISVNERSAKSLMSFSWLPFLQRIISDCVNFVSSDGGPYQILRDPQASHRS